jgi:hypothetical protein
MLIDIDSDKEITHMPHEKSFKIWRSRLSQHEFDAIVEKLNSLIAGNEVHTSSWMPGHNWSGTVYDPIYRKACSNNVTDSGLFFGLIVWHVFQTHPDQWYFGRFEKDGMPIPGMTYFKKRD